MCIQETAVATGQPYLAIIDEASSAIGDVYLLNGHNVIYTEGL